MAPSEYLRLPVPYPVPYEVDWQPESVWACKVTADGGTDSIEGKMGDLGDSDPNGPIDEGKENLLSLVTNKNRQSDDKD